MNLTDFTYLINKPEALNEKHTESLEKVLDEFPYFQSARVLRLKHLYNQDSFKYNHALKIAASYTNDRSVLFYFITSDSFVSVQKGLYEKKLEELLNIRVFESEHVIVEAKPINTLEQSILSSIKVATSEEIKAETKLDIGKPLEFSKDEKHSFQEWLQLSRLKPIIRESDTVSNSEKSLLEVEKKKHIDLIDKFIADNPKITPLAKDTSIIAIERPTEDTTYLMTETLARVYLEQKKYSKAIQAYEILILKYPEKSSFFADRISDIKVVQQNNN